MTNNTTVTTTESSAVKQKNSSGLGVWALAGIVISSMIGGGIYSLPQNMAAGASAGAVILAWLITGIGVYFIVNTFRTLSAVRPDLTAGIYMYSREGFGPYVGFTIGWAYWLCQICGNVGYAVITMDALNYFFPHDFTGGNNLYSIIGGSILIWVFNALVLRGIKQATFVNLIGTVAKIVPLVLFILVVAFMFQFDKFEFNFWGEDASSAATLGGLPEQIKSTMMVTLWAFIGIEGAVVMSQHAKSPQTVGRATFLGYIGCLAIYILLSVLPFGVMSQEELAKVANPSTAGVLEALVGKWGSYLMNIGVLISVLTSWLAWTMITAQIPQAAAENGTFPKEFAMQNDKDAPVVSLWVTSTIMQLFMFLVYFSSNAWNTMLTITGVMVLPAYLSSCAYLWKICEDHEYPTNFYIKRSSALLSSIFGVGYSAWLIYAAGLKYLMLAVIFMALGIPVYVWAKHQNEPDAPFFSHKEKCLAIFMMFIAFVALYSMISGIVKL